MAKGMRVPKIAMSFCDFGENVNRSSFRQGVVDVHGAPIIEKVRVRLATFRQGVVVVFSVKPLRNDLPAHGVGVVEHLTTVLAESAGHVAGGGLEYGECVTALADTDLVAVPGQHGMVGHL